MTGTEAYLMDYILSGCQVIRSGEEIDQSAGNADGA